MFRLSQYIDAIYHNKPIPKRQSAAPVVIWNLLRRCNLTCKHCYSTSANTKFKGEMATSEILKKIDDLYNFGVRVLILSGGEPLMHPDIFLISSYAKAKGFYLGLSSNGTLIDKKNISKITEINYNYVGISIDGMAENHDKFRQQKGAFQQALNGIFLCQDAGIKVGLRTTLTQDNIADLEQILALMDKIKIDKFYLSHLNYAGRGNLNRHSDLHFGHVRKAMDLLFTTCWQNTRAHKKLEIVTGNNDADAVYLLLWLKKHYPHYNNKLLPLLYDWGGNSSGVNIANIDNKGNVHADTMWWDYSLGNIKERPFGQIWQDTSDPLMAALKQKPRAVEGRCGLCQYLDICAGNSRTRAWQLTGNFLAEDPGCYLNDKEIGIS